MQSVSLKTLALLGLSFNLIATILPLVLDWIGDAILDQWARDIASNMGTNPNPTQRSSIMFKLQMMFINFYQGKNTNGVSPETARHRAAEHIEKRKRQSLLIFLLIGFALQFIAVAYS